MDTPFLDVLTSWIIGAVIGISLAFLLGYIIGCINTLRKIKKSFPTGRRSVFNSEVERKKRIGDLSKELDKIR